MLKILSLLVVVSATASLAGGSVLYDDFNDGGLDPAWSVSNVTAGGHTGTEAGTNYTVSKIDWATWGANHIVQLTRPLDSALAGDFQVDFDISWAMTEWRSIQGLQIKLLDASDSVIAATGMSDGWGSAGPGVWWKISENEGHTGTSTLPLSGSGLFDIVRNDGTISITCNDNPVASGAAGGTVAKAQIEFSAHYYWTAQYPNPADAESGFGAESVDLVNVVPEPTSLAVLAMGAAACLVRRKRV